MQLSITDNVRALQSRGKTLKRVLSSPYFTVLAVNAPYLSFVR